MIDHKAGVELNVEYGKDYMNVCWGGVFCNWKAV